VGQFSEAAVLGLAQTGPRPQVKTKVKAVLRLWVNRRREKMVGVGADMFETFKRKPG
jgi:hypothetical protein